MAEMLDPTPGIVITCGGCGEVLKKPFCAPCAMSGPAKAETARLEIEKTKGLIT